MAEWPSSRAELIEAQVELGRARPPPWHPESDQGEVAVAGCFVCFPRGVSGPGARGDPAWAGAALVRGATVVTAVAAGEAGAPYEPGLLALREGPLLEDAVRALGAAPDILLVNATGRDHPRRAGLALQLGAVLEVPTVGVTNRPLIAEGRWPASERGASSPLVMEGETVGCWLRTRRGRHPLAVHLAWRAGFEAAVDVVLATTGKSRTPEALRQARRVARVARAAVR